MRAAMPRKTHRATCQALGASTLKALCSAAQGCPTTGGQPWVADHTRPGTLKRFCRAMSGGLHNPFRVGAHVWGVNPGLASFVGQPWAVLRNPFRGRPHRRTPTPSPPLPVSPSPPLSPRAAWGFRAQPPSRPRKAVGDARDGLTLFEVIVALAIFMGAICAIGQLIGNGVRSAVQCRLHAQGVLRAETIMAELAAGLIPLRSAGGVAFPDDNTWNWSVSVTSSGHPDLYIVEVTAAHPSATRAGNVSYSLRRYVRDPNVAIAAYEKQLQQQQAQQQQQSSSSSSSSSGGSK